MNLRRYVSGLAALLAHLGFVLGPVLHSPEHSVAGGAQGSFQTVVEGSDNHGDAGDYASHDSDHCSVCQLLTSTFLSLLAPLSVVAARDPGVTSILLADELALGSFLDNASIRGPPASLLA